MITATILSIIAFLFNFLLIKLMWGKERLRERRSNMFLVNLLLANACASLASLSFDVYSLFCPLTEYHNIHVMFDLILGTTNLLLLFSISGLSADRLCTIKWPFRYSHVKDKDLRQTIAALWVTALLYFTLLFLLCKVGRFDVHYTILHTTIKVSIAFGFVTLSTSSTVVYIEARKQIRKVYLTGSKANEDTVRRNARIKCEYRLALISVGVVLKYLACWIPAGVLMTLEYLNEEKQTVTFAYTAWQLDTINCICDPIIYISLSKDVKEEFLLLFCQKKRRRVSMEAMGMNGREGNNNAF